jgi:hypothetical protein
LIFRSIPAENSSGISGAGGSVQASASIQASAPWMTRVDEAGLKRQ